MKPMGEDGSGGGLLFLGVSLVAVYMVMSAYAPTVKSPRIEHQSASLVRAPLIQPQLKTTQTPARRASRAATQPRLPVAESEEFNAFNQCDAGDFETIARTDDMTLVLNQFLPTGVSTHCNRQAVLHWEDRPVTLNLIVYGQIGGCPQNCHANSLCVLVDRQQPLLYAASWEHAEGPLTLGGQCPKLQGAREGSTNLYCESPTAGQLHPISTSLEFVQFMVNAPEFQSCFSGLP